MNFFVPDVWRMDRENVDLVCPACEATYPIPRLSRGELRQLVDATRYIKLEREHEFLCKNRDVSGSDREARISFLKDFLDNQKRDIERSCFTCDHCEGQKLILPDGHYFQTVDDEPWSEQHP